MVEQEDLKKIKELIEEFFEKMTITVSNIDVGLSNTTEGSTDVVNLDIKLEEPQILIGQGGQTLFEIQRLLKTVLNKKIKNVFYFNLDINDYKKQKVEHLRSMAKGLADQVAITKEEKSLLPMTSYERRVIHDELAQRTDIVTESQGEGPDRHIIIKPK